MRDRPGGLRAGASAVLRGLLLASCGALPKSGPAPSRSGATTSSTSTWSSPGMTRRPYSTPSTSRAPSAPPARPSRPTASASRPTTARPPVPVPTLRAATRRALPEATTFTAVARAEHDTDRPPTGELAHLPADRDVVGFRHPGREAVVRVPVFQLAHRTVLPVVRRQPGWVQVRLPSKPNGALAWLPAGDVRLERDDWRAVVDLGARTLTLTRGAARQGHWPVGVGEAATPTPAGQTFLMSRFDSPPGHYTPVTFVLGTHSRTLDTYGGGPGTVAFHGWPTRAGRTGEVSHGCVRVPDEALTLLRRAPLGMPVLIR